MSSDWFSLSSRCWLCYSFSLRSFSSFTQTSVSGSKDKYCSFYFTCSSCFTSQLMPSIYSRTKLLLCFKSMHWDENGSLCFKKLSILMNFWQSWSIQITLSSTPNTNSSKYCVRFFKSSSLCELKYVMSMSSMPKYFSISFILLSRSSRSWLSISKVDWSISEEIGCCTTGTFFICQSLMFATASTSSWTFYSAVSSLLASFASFGAAGSTFDVEVSTTEALLAPVLLVEASSLLAAGCTYATGYDSSFEDS